MVYHTEGTDDVLAVPYDIPVVGYGGTTVNKLRVWSAEPVEEQFDLDAFNAGDYAKAQAHRAEAEAISAILYPNDAGEHGRLLRLKQEYLFVAAGLSSVLDTFRSEHGNDWRLLPRVTVAIHTNDTHPAMCRASSSCACSLTRSTSSGTRHGTSPRRPSPTRITRFCPRHSRSGPSPRSRSSCPACTRSSTRSARRYNAAFDRTQGGWQERLLRQTAILWDGEVRMANLSVICSHSVNGVAKLHTDILERETLKDFYALTPQKFNNKTNGISHRRFLAEANPTCREAHHRSHRRGLARRRLRAPPRNSKPSRATRASSSAWARRSARTRCALPPTCSASAVSPSTRTRSSMSR